MDFCLSQNFSNGINVLWLPWHHSMTWNPCCTSQAVVGLTVCLGSLSRWNMASDVQSSPACLVASHSARCICMVMLRDALTPVDATRSLWRDAATHLMWSPTSSTVPCKLLVYQLLFLVPTDIQSMPSEDTTLNLVNLSVHRTFARSPASILRPNEPWLSTVLLSVLLTNKWLCLSNVSSQASILQTSVYAVWWQLYSSLVSHIFLDYHWCFEPACHQLDLYSSITANKSMSGTASL